MPATTTFHPGVTARLHILSTPSFRFAVAVANDPADAVPDPTPGRMTAMLTHDEGLKQPDTRGWALGVATAECGGTPLLCFATLADGLTFKAQLEGGAE